ncbi:hypothetical protein K7432_008272 [Basidiobolus ranarum]|uniref:HCP-like protein n=1 Tax=Basidiobolus ranarum TaxID=34480 RepID=A0ABR2VYX7_9FUNG
MLSPETRHSTKDRVTNRSKKPLGPRPYPSTAEYATVHSNNKEETPLIRVPHSLDPGFNNDSRTSSNTKVVYSPYMYRPQSYPPLYYNYGYLPPPSSIANTATRVRPQFSHLTKNNFVGALPSTPIPSTYHVQYNYLYPPPQYDVQPPPTPPVPLMVEQSNIITENEIILDEGNILANVPDDSLPYESDEDIEKELRDRFQALCMSTDTDHSSPESVYHNSHVYGSQSTVGASCSNQEHLNTLQNQHCSHFNSSVNNHALVGRNSDDSLTSDDYATLRSSTISSQCLSPRPTSIIELRPKDFSPSKLNRNRNLNHTNPPLLNLPGPSASLKRSMSATTQRASLTLVNEESALGMYRETAKKTNDPRIQLEFAKYLLSLSTMFGDPNAKDGNTSIQKLLDEAIFWIKRLQKSGQPEAMFIFAGWLEKGMYNFPQNPDKALSLYKSSSKYGFVKSTYKVGHFYERKKEYSRAVQFYLKAASRGDVSANYRLGTAYLYGEIKLKPNLNHAMLYLSRSAKEANKDCPNGAYLYGTVLTGDFKLVDITTLHHDLEMGQEYIEKAARLGYCPALYRLGTCYEFGELGYPVNPLKSIEFFREGAEKGDPDCQMGLSGWYASGAEGILEQNDDLAHSWCFQAACKGLPKAEFAMGYYYEIGVGVPVDLHNANNWYIKAAAHGSQDAQRRLANGTNTIPLKRDIGAIRQEKHEQSDCIIS